MQLNAARAAVAASETISRKPIATTRPKGAQAIDQECLEVSTRIRLHPPYRVQRRLELEERAGGGDDERDAADRGGDDARSSLTSLHREDFVRRAHPRARQGDRAG
jgi:hypothetical protein